MIPNLKMAGMVLALCVLVSGAWRPFNPTVPPEAGARDLLVSPDGRYVAFSWCAGSKGGAPASATVLVLDCFGQVVAQSTPCADRRVVDRPLAWFEGAVFCRRVLYAGPGDDTHGPAWTINWAGPDFRVEHLLLSAAAQAQERLQWPQKAVVEYALAAGDDTLFCFVRDLEIEWEDSGLYRARRAGQGWQLQPLWIRKDLSWFGDNGEVLWVGEEGGGQRALVTRHLWGSRDNTLGFWELVIKDGEVIHTHDRGGLDLARGLPIDAAASPDGTMVVAPYVPRARSVDRDRPPGLWRLAVWRRAGRDWQQSHIEVPATARHVSFSPSGRLMVLWGTLDPDEEDQVVPPVHVVRVEDLAVRPVQLRCEFRPVNSLAWLSEREILVAHDRGIAKVNLSTAESFWEPDGAAVIVRPAEPKR